MKFIDDITDKNVPLHPFFIITGGLAYGLLMGYLMTVDSSASLLFGGIILGCLITGKINSTGHYFGLSGIIAVIFLYGIKLSPVVLLIGVLAALDEVKDMVPVPARLEFIFDYRLVLKTGILASVILNIVEFRTFLVLLVFDLAYMLTGFVDSRLFNEI